MFHARHRTFMRSMLFGGLLTLGVSAPQARRRLRAAHHRLSHLSPAVSEEPAATPDDAMVAKVRKAIKDEKAIAIYAESIKVIVRDGIISLKGPVRTDAEKKAIRAKADAIAGEANAMNNLMVAPDHADLPKPSTN